MRDKAEVEFEKVRKKHSEHISSVQINLGLIQKLQSVDIKLRPGRVVYVINFNKKSVRGTDVDVVNKFEVSRADILNGSFANSFDGFSKYDSKGKLGLLMGLGYVLGNDVEIITPKVVGNLTTEGMNLSDLLLGHRADSKAVYKKNETAGRKTDTSPKQGGAGIGATKRKKEEVVTWVFSVHEITGISERSGSPIFAKGIKVKVKRAYYDSAQNFVKSKYSYQKTGKHYFVELDKIER